MPASEYTPEEQQAARIIASLIYPAYPGGPDLDSDTGGLGLYAAAVDAVRDPYETAAVLMEKTGKLYDSPGDAATVWEGLRQMTSAATPYARIDPLVRELGGAAHAPSNGAAKPPPKPRAPRQAAPATLDGPLGEQPQSRLIIEKLATLGYTFRLNRCNDTIEVNGWPITDILQAEIRMKLRDVGLAKQLAAAEDAYIAEAKQNAYHPARDYLDVLEWDKDDHIGDLAGCLQSSDPPVIYPDGTRLPLHHVYFYRWLIGAVAKVYNGEQNAMLVMDGPQGIGKSTLARWLCPLAEYFLEGPINVADKDSDVRLISQWIWEVSELDATTRKADQSALKAFITKQVVTVRKSYGRHDTKKPAMCSLIGTVNNTSGFLADESGSRRFMITKIDRIDRRYQQLNLDQIWAQAKALYFDNEPWQLQGPEAAMQRAVNERYEAETVLTDWLDRSFTFHPEYDEPYSLADIIATMAADGVKIGGSERSQAMELSRALMSKKARKDHTRGGNKWYGLMKKPW